MSPVMVFVARAVAAFTAVPLPIVTTMKAKNRPSKKTAKRVRVTRADDAVALAVGRALMRKPRVNTALLEMMRRNRDLLPL